MVKPFIERLDTHRLNAPSDQFADRVFHHRGDNAGVEAKAVREICSHVVFAAADVNRALMRFAKGKKTGIEAMHHRAQRNKVQRALLRHAEPVGFCSLHVGETLLDRIAGTRALSWV